MNRDLIALERIWLLEPGIPGRPWFKHLLYAPCHTYAAMRLPGVTEAAEAKNWTLARTQLELLVSKVEATVSLVNRTTALLPDPCASRAALLEATRCAALRRGRAGFAPQQPQSLGTTRQGARERAAVRWRPRHQTCARRRGRRWLPG